jgi:hypothetical protein
MRLAEIPIMTLAGVWQGIRQDFNLLEIALIVLGIWAWTKHGWCPRNPRWTWMPRRPWVAAAALIAGVIALRLALLPLLPVPVPIVADEFSHLLLADTLLHGRVANPAHPFWQHFESLHILQQPHYVSSYFPGHALVLAAGIVALGSPWAGVLAECAAFLGILYWALRGWMPPRWALFGVLLAALRFAIGSYWVNAYHGGFLPAAGGALIFGAFARLRRSASFSQGLFWQGLVLGLGLAIVAGTRPFEGLAFALPFMAMLAWEFRSRFSALARIAIPAAAVAGMAVVSLSAYFGHITGSPFVTTYQISQKTYGWPMGLAWTPIPRIEHRHIELARYYQYEIGEREKVDGPIDFIEYLTFRLQEYWRFFLGPALTVPLIMLPRVWKRRRILFAGLAGGLAAILLEGAASPHYLAPATAVIVAILVECCRHLHASRIRILRLLPAVMALVLVLRIGAQTAGLPYTQKLNFQSWCCRVQGNLNKARIAAALERIPGDHLVFVKTKTDETNLFQWIYNDADIDRSRIVWARDLGPDRNRQLAAYFAVRQVWLVDPNVEPATCVRYDAASVITSETASRSSTPPPPPDRQ